MCAKSTQYPAFCFFAHCNFGLFEAPNIRVAVPGQFLE
ncbi:hypothetical protein JL2886_03936 [Phaeobacter gallaeciensis]|uniref:Uncharacterized protein n=1 Tax=Phaeobacter gallaeciensis TaxID=60890 RepID=A0A1B0ZXH7_9RHOB|nr:hypothetical protein JL2886_03936 [Phaeobacter gallaeciensis]